MYDVHYVSSIVINMGKGSSYIIFIILLICLYILVKYENYMQHN